MSSYPEGAAVAVADLLDRCAKIEAGQEVVLLAHLDGLHGGDIRSASFKVGDTLVHDRGYLTALDHPAVVAMAKKYSDRPGLDAARESPPSGK